MRSSSAGKGVLRARRWTCAVLLLLCAWGSCLARAGSAVDAGAWMQRSDAVFRRAINESLAVVVMAQDHAGWMWLGMQSGLARWDGHRLHRYQADSGRAGALPDSYVLALHVDPVGRLWVGTSAGGLVRYDPAGDRFVSPLDRDASLSGASVHALLSDGPDRLWVGTGQGLDLLDTRDGRVQRGADGAGHAGLPKRAVHALLRGSDGTLWVGTATGLYRRRGAGPHFEAVPLSTTDGAPAHVAKLAQDREGRIWIGTRAQGAFVAASGDAEPRPLHRLLDAAPRTLAQASISDIIEAAPGEVWLGTDGEGIVRVDTVRWRWRTIRHQPRTPASLPDDDVFALLRDRRGLVWVASDSAVSLHDVRQRLIATWFGGSGLERGLGHANVPAVLPLPEGDVWLAGGDGGIDIVRPDEGRIARISPGTASPHSMLPPGRVLSMVRDGGEVLLGTQRGLYRADAHGRGVRRLSVPGRAATASVWALASHDGRLWIGGLDGLWSLRRLRDGSLQTAHHADGAELGEQRITFLLPASPHALWIGTRAGVLHLDTTTGALTRPPHDAPGRVGLPGGYIASMLLDGRGRLWVASFGNGVRVLDASSGAEPRVHRITQAEGLPHNGVNAIVADRDGHVWASTDGGLARIDRDRLTARSYTDAEGVGVATYWTGAGAAAADGALLFGGSGGLTIVDPRQAPAPQEPPPLAVNELRLGDDPPRFVHRLPETAAAWTLPPGRRSLFVELAVLDYASPARNRYQHRLVGVDADWVDSGATRRIAAYSQLPPGNHVLELRGAAPDGPWSPPLVLQLHVPPEWHERHWFRALLAVAGAAFIVVLVQARTLMLRRRQRLLEALVTERTSALEQRTLELQRSQQQLERMAYHDGLTGLPNRRCFNEELRRLVAQAQRGGSGFQLMLIDLDHFKQVNDTQGHAAGDAVLMALAACLQAAVREGDLVARIGGDEFAVLLPNVVDRGAVDSVACRIYAALAAQREDPPPTMMPVPGVSIGASGFPRDAADADALVQAADAALYAAKREGRNRWYHHGGAASMSTADPIAGFTSPP